MDQNHKDESDFKHKNPEYCETKSGKWIKTVRSIMDGMEFGEIQLTVYRGQVVEIRKIEKIRLDQPESAPSKPFKRGLTDR